jgi:hypothetical protein
MRIMNEHLKLIKEEKIKEIEEYLSSYSLINDSDETLKMLVHFVRVFTTLIGSENEVFWKDQEHYSGQEVLFRCYGTMKDWLFPEFEETYQLLKNKQKNKIRTN